MLSNIELRRIPEALSGIPIQTLIIGFLIYLFFVLMKALRFKSILNIELPLRRFFPIIALHTFWTNLLPMRAGDVSYIYLLKSREKVAGTKSVASLMVASVLDILLQLTLIVGIAWYFKPRLASKMSYASFLFIPFFGILALLAIISIALVLPKRCVIMTERLALTFQRLKTPVLLPLLNSKFRIPNSEFLFGGLSWLADKLAQVVHELTDISLRFTQGQAFNMKLLNISACSVIILAARFGMQCYLVKAMGFNLSILEILFALAFTAFCNMFPVQGVASIGTIELPWAWALISLGASKDAAIVSGFSLHIIIILYCVILGLYGAINRK